MPSTQTKTALVTLRLTGDQKDKARRLGDALGVGLSGVVRASLSRFLQEAATEQASK